MQVADAIAAPLARVEAGRRAVAELSGSGDVEGVSVFTRHTMQYIASSTRLSGAQKKGLIRLVAMVDELGGGDPKTIMAILKMAQALETGTGPGTYRAHSMKAAMAEYWSAREQMRLKTVDTPSVREEISRFAAEQGVETALLESGTLEA